MAEYRIQEAGGKTTHFTIEGEGDCHEQALEWFRQHCETSNRRSLLALTLPRGRHWPAAVSEIGLDGKHKIQDNGTRQQARENYRRNKSIR